MNAPLPQHDPGNPWAAPTPAHPTAWPPAPSPGDGPGYRPLQYAAAGQPGSYDQRAVAYLYAPPPPRSLKGIGMTTVVLLGVQALLALAAAGVAAWGVLSWSRVSGASTDVQLPADQAKLVLTVLRAPLSALTGIAFVAWVWTATRNARNAGARVRHAPGWALGGWLVPILNLWRPKQMIDDLWRASMPGVPTGIDLRFVRKPVGITCWWAAYLIGTSLPAIAITKATVAVLKPNLEALMNGLPPVAVDMARVHESTAMYDLWASVLMVLAAGLAMHFVHHITSWQDDRTTPALGRQPHEVGVRS